MSASFVVFCIQYINIWVIMCKKNSGPILVIFSLSLWLQCALMCLPKAWNLVVAGQHLIASHPSSLVWPNPNITIFSDNYFWKTLNCHISSGIRIFDLISNLRANPEYPLFSGIKYMNVIPCESHQHYLDIETTQTFLDNPSGPQSNEIKYKFMTWIWSLFGPQMFSHI